LLRRCRGGSWRGGGVLPESSVSICCAVLGLRIPGKERESQDRREREIRAGDSTGEERVKE
jgi:hypothetical protein